MTKISSSSAVKSIIIPANFNVMGDSISTLLDVEFGECDMIHVSGCDANNFEIVSVPMAIYRNIANSQGVMEKQKSADGFITGSVPVKVCKIHFAGLGWYKVESSLGIMIPLKKEGENAVPKEDYEILTEMYLTPVKIKSNTASNGKVQLRITKVNTTPSPDIVQDVRTVVDADIAHLKRVALAKLD